MPRIPPTRAYFWILLFPLCALAVDTEAIPKSDLLKRVAMTTVFYGSFDRPVHTHDFVLTETDDGLKLATGRDKSGKPWEAALPAPMSGLWKVDRHGSRTYYFAGYTGGAGMAPGTWILALSFDERGRPVPFYMMTYGALYDSNGIKDLLDLDGQGPELLQQEWFETNWSHETRSGYFVTALYEHRGTFWYRADGRHGASSFPLYEKGAFLPNNRPELVLAPPELKESLPDYSNDPRTGVRTTILGVVTDQGIRTGSEFDCDLDDRPHQHDCTASMMWSSPR